VGPGIITGLVIIPGRCFSDGLPGGLLGVIGFLIGGFGRGTAELVDGDFLKPGALGIGQDLGQFGLFLGLDHLDLRLQLGDLGPVRAADLEPMEFQLGSAKIFLAMRPIPDWA